MVWTRLLPLIATVVTGAVAEAAVLKQCVAPHLRQNCPGTEGGQAGCEQRGCCFDNTRGGDWCSHFDPAPPAPPPPAPTAVVWEQCSGPMRGDDCARVGGRCDCVKVHASGGASLWLDGAQWITERPPGVCADLFAGFLSVDAGIAINGTDPRLGPFEGFRQTVTAPPAFQGTVLSTRVWLEAEGSTALEFSVQLPETAGAVPVRPGSCGHSPVIAFPFGGEVTMPAAWLTWRGDAPGEDGMTRHVYGSSTATDTGVGDTAPLVLVGAGGTTIVVAPSDEFLTTQVALASSRLTVGPQPTLTAGLPPGYAYSVSVTLNRNSGVTSTVMDWGRTLQLKYGTASARSALPANPLNEQLSYTTALGEYFDYLAWKDQRPPPGGPTPQDALLNVSRHFQAAGLPIKLFMLDIWWVHNDARGAPQRHCMYDWQPIQSYFPKGLDWLANATGAGMMPYANYLCDNSSYTTATGGKWHTMNGSSHGNVFPNESRAFWAERFADAKQNFGTAQGAFWNDHMSENMDNYAEMKSVPGAMRQWMAGQADAALASSTPIMYCMEKPSQMVQAVEFPAVTTGRASSDYHPPSANWFLGPESLLLAAIGKSASKDGINTGAAPNHEGVTEVNPVLHTLTATLTRGPVSVGDRIGKTNFTVLKPCCSSSGTILSPSHALKPIDATYQPGSVANGLQFTGVWGAAQAVWTAFSEVGTAAAYTVLAVSLPEEYPMKPTELWPAPPANSSLWAFDWGATSCAAGRPVTGCLRAVTDESPLLLSTPPETRLRGSVVHGLQHSVVTREMPGGWVVLGEPAKYVPLSPARFTVVSATQPGERLGPSALTLAVRGAPGEVVEVLLKKPGLTVLTMVTMSIGVTGVAQATVSAN